MASKDKNLWQAIGDARAKFGPVLKTQINPHYRNKYADLASVLDAVEAALAAEGLVLVQFTRATESGVLLITRLVFAADGSNVESEYPLNPGKPNDPQALGGALTYARRYQALCVLGIAPEDDDGEAASRPAPEEKPKKATSNKLRDNATMMARVQAAAEGTGLTPGVLAQMVGRPSFAAVEVSDFDKLLAAIAAHKEEARG